MSPIMGAIFAIPTAAAVLSVTDYLRERDVLLRADDAVDEPVPEERAATEAVAPGEEV